MEICSSLSNPGPGTGTTPWISGSSARSANGFNFLVGYSYIREKPTCSLEQCRRPRLFLNDLGQLQRTLHWLDSPIRITGLRSPELRVPWEAAFLSKLAHCDAALGAGRRSLRFFNSGPYLQFPAAQVDGDPTISTRRPAAGSTPRSSKSCRRTRFAPSVSYPEYGVRSTGRRRARFRTVPIKGERAHAS